MLGFKTFFFGASLLFIVAGAPIEQTSSSMSNSSMTFHDILPDGYELVSLKARAASFFKCETSGGSPLADDLTNAAQQVTERTFCCQDNGGGSQCQEKSAWHTAAIGMCGAVFPVHCVNCIYLSNAALRVVKECSWRDPSDDKVKAGGYLQYADLDIRVISYHT